MLLIKEIHCIAASKLTSFDSSPPCPTSSCLPCTRMFSVTNNAESQIGRFVKNRAYSNMFHVLGKQLRLTHGKKQRLRGLSATLRICFPLLRKPPGSSCENSVLMTLCHLITSPKATALNTTVEVSTLLVTHSEC